MNIFKFKIFTLLFTFFFLSGMSHATLTPVEAEILALTNQARQKAGLEPLQLNSALVKAARIQSITMAKTKQFSHTTNGKLSTRVKNVGYPYKKVGENIAYGNSPAATIFKGWMKSKGHRKNILCKDFKEIGVGIAVGKHGAIYYTQIFGKRK